MLNSPGHDSRPPAAEFRAPADLKINYAADLNPQQYAAVTAEPGPALVIAGAGSGKTRALTYRVAFLLEQGIPADRILLLTFTNKAAKEMMNRAADLVGAEFAGLWGGTFHAVGARILRRHAELVGYRPDFAILDREDAARLIKTCLAESAIDTITLPFPKAEVLAEIFSLAANTQCPLRRVAEFKYDFASRTGLQIEELAVAYAARKRATNVMDFDDLLILWLKLLQDHPEIREHYQRKFQFILVDEYQDTNKLQCDLIDLLAARHQNLMVVGDDSQSIYAWRGAEYRNILEFSDRYPRAKIYKIELNYRSTPEILALANAAIAANLRQYKKELAPVKKPGQKPVLVICEDARQQAAFVAHRVCHLHEEGRPLRRMAVLYRSHVHAVELQLELTRRHLPFTITSGLRLFEQAHLKDVIAYLRLIYNPRDELSFKRLVLMLPGVGDKAAVKLWQQYSAALAAAPPAQPAARDNAAQTTAHLLVSPALASCTALPKKAASGWSQFMETIRQIEAAAVPGGPVEMLRIIAEAGYADYLKATYANFHARMEDLTQLAEFSRQFSGLEELLTQLSLLTNLEAEGETTPARDDEKIRLSTVHQAKGLEWDIVFVIMLCENSFPAERAMKIPDAAEEERRLFYVAITRARDELYLSYPLFRAAHKHGPVQYESPSRFLAEIPRTIYEECRLTGL